MKKITTLLLSLALILSLSMSVSAFEAPETAVAGYQGGTLNLTATVPADPSYKIYIPKDAALTYGTTTEQYIGDVEVGEAQNIPDDSCIKVYITGTDMYKMSDEGGLDKSKSIPVTYAFYENGSETPSSGNVNNGSTQFSTVLYQGGTSIAMQLSTKISAKVSSWTADPGSYKATIDFNFYVEKNAE